MWCTGIVLKPPATIPGKIGSSWMKKCLEQLDKNLCLLLHVSLWLEPSWSQLDRECYFVCSSTKFILGSKEVGDLCSKWYILWAKVLTRWSLWFLSVKDVVLKVYKCGPLCYVNKTGSWKARRISVSSGKLFLNLLCWPSTNRRPVCIWPKQGFILDQQGTVIWRLAPWLAKRQERRALWKKGKGVGRVVVNRVCWRNAEFEVVALC